MTKTNNKNKSNQMVRYIFDDDDNFEFLFPYRFIENEKKRFGEIERFVCNWRNCLRSTIKKKSQMEKIKYDGKEKVVMRVVMVYKHDEKHKFVHSWIKTDSNGNDLFLQEPADAGTIDEYILEYMVTDSNGIGARAYKFGGIEKEGWVLPSLQPTKQ
jgi:hypothetical protein